LGYALLRKRDFAHAQEYFRRAADLDSKDPRVHYYSALLLNEEGGFATDPEKIAFMKKELQASIALDSSFADAYALLAFAQSSSGDHDQALASLKKAIELNPRNDSYQFNLAVMYLSQQKLDDGIALLTALQSSATPEIALRAASTLREAQAVKANMLRAAESSNRTEPVRVSTNENAVRGEAGAVNHDEPTPVLIRNTEPPKFLKGKLLSVDCSAQPSALLTVLAAGKTWKMNVSDTHRAVVIGADNFNCSWTNQKIALNYREAGDGQGSVVSIELQ
jgi:tetratricopeptide (TPR) repeat protein